VALAEREIIDGIQEVGFSHAVFSNKTIDVGA
jgi:hypothetical protein